MDWYSRKTGLLKITLLQCDHKLSAALERAEWRTPAEEDLMARRTI